MDSIHLIAGTISRTLQDSAAIRAGDSVLANASALIGRPYQRAVGHAGFEAVVGPIICLKELLYAKENVLQASFNLARTCLMSAERGIHLLPKRVEKLGMQMGRLPLLRCLQSSPPCRLLARLGLNRLVRVTSIGYYGARLVRTADHLRYDTENWRLQLRLTMCAMQILATGASFTLGGAPLVVLGLIASGLELADRAVEHYDQSDGAPNMSYGKDALDIAKGSATIAHSKGKVSEESLFLVRCADSLSQLSLASSFCKTIEKWTKKGTQATWETALSDTKTCLATTLDILLPLPGISRITRLHHMDRVIHHGRTAAQVLSVAYHVSKLWRKGNDWYYGKKKGGPSKKKKMSPAHKWSIRLCTATASAAKAGGLATRLLKLHPNEPLIKGLTNVAVGVSGIVKTLLSPIPSPAA